MYDRSSATRSELPLCSLDNAGRFDKPGRVNLWSVLGWMKTPAGNRYRVKQRWGVGGDWIWEGGSQRGSAQSYDLAVMQAVSCADEVHPSRWPQRRGTR